MSETQTINDPGFTISPARYAKRQMAVHCLSNGSGFKTRAMRLCDHLNARWSGRESAYIMSQAKAEKLQRLHTAGYDAFVLSRELIAPEGNGE